MEKPGWLVHGKFVEVHGLLHDEEGASTTYELPVVES